MPFSRANCSVSWTTRPTATRCSRPKPTSAARAKLSLLQAGYRSEEIAQVRSEMAQRQSAFAYADSFLKRQQGLWAKNATSADALEDARTARNQAQANLQAAKDKLSQYQRQPPARNRTGQGRRGAERGGAGTGAVEPARRHAGFLPPARC